MNGCNNQTFETYMVSSSNRMAFRAAETAAEHPGEKFTPLCLFGAGGLGKTHLLCAVHERIRKQDADAVICTFTAEEFSGALLKAIQDGKTERLRAQLKQTDALLIDDLQYLAGKTQTQKEFLRVLNDAAEEGCQVVMASSVPPEELRVLTEGLAGSDKALMADIQIPEPGESLGFVRQAAERYGMTLPEETLEQIAERAGGDYRRIIGILTRMQAETELSNPPVEQGSGLQRDTTERQNR